MGQYMSYSSPLASRGYYFPTSCPDVHFLLAITVVYRLQGTLWITNSLAIEIMRYDSDTR